MKIIRVLVYEGDEQKLRRQMEGNGVKGFHTFNGITITEYIDGYSYPAPSAEDKEKGLAMLIDRPPAKTGFGNV